MDDSAPLPDADACLFTLSVWPQTATRAWQAQVRASAAAAALRFDRPVDLVLYLTELAPAADAPRRGLR